MSTPSLIQRGLNALFNFSKPHRRSELFDAVTQAIKADGCAYTYHNCLGGKKQPPQCPVRLITAVSYDRNDGLETYDIFDPYTHTRSKFSYTPEEAPRGILMHPGNFKDFTITSCVDERLASSYASKAVGLHRVVEWVVGNDAEGNLLTLFSGSRPCGSSRLSDGNIINFHVLDNKTLAFKHMIHWDYTKGHLWGANLLSINEGRALLSHWILSSDPEHSLFSWTFKTQRYVEQDRPQVRDRWGTPCIEGFNYGDLVSTPDWMGMVVGECTPEKGDCMIIVVDYPGRRDDPKVTYRPYHPSRLNSLVDLVNATEQTFPKTTA